MKQFKTLKNYVFKNLKYFIFGFICLIIVDTLQLVVPIIVKNVVDALASGIYSKQKLLNYGLIIASIGIITAVCRFSWRYCIIGSSRRIERELRDKIFSHVIKLPMNALLERKTGDLMARMTNDLEAVRMFTGIGLVALLDTIFLGIASISFMVYINPLLTVLSLTPMFFIIIVTWRLSSLLHHRFASVQASFSTLTETVRETIAGISVIKAYINEDISLKNFSSVSREYIDKNISLVKILGLFFPLIVLFSNLSICVLLYFGGKMTLLNQITPGDFVAFASYIWILTWPMMALGWVVNIFQRASASMIRINEILEEEPETILSKIDSKIELNGDIEIKDLTFSYKKASVPSLQNINLKIKHGQTVGITGKTGSGKTTLLNLIQNFFSPPENTIFIDGKDIQDIPLFDLRSNISYVPQDSFLFSDSIKENILFGNTSATDQEVRKNAEISQLYNEIMEFKDGFDTEIGEKGITLSGGQKQRLCISRALIKKTPILILDDSLSSLDVSTTQKIVNSLKSAEKMQTTIIVSNRIASIKHADNILVFSEGRITEQGTHNELIKKDGLYRDLHLMQQLENEL
jgi:ATP-binding cassette subfamily B protein